MANIENGNNTSGLANVDLGYNLRVTTPQASTRAGGETGAPNYVGGVRIFAENDSGLYTGTPILSSPYVTFNNNLQMGLMTPMFEYSFNGAAQDTANTYHAFTTMTATQSGGSLLLNANSTNGSATGCYISTKRFFPLIGNAGMKVGSIVAFTQPVLANEVFCFGLGIPVSTTAQPTDGAFFQYTSAGVIGVIAYNGTVTQTGVLPVGQTAFMPTTGQNYLFEIRIHDRQITFQRDTVLLGTAVIPSGQGVPFMTDALPLFVQMYNSGIVTGTSMQVKVSTLIADQLDQNINKPYPHIQVSKGLSLYQGLQGGTMGATAFWAASANPTTALPVAGSLTANLPTSLSGGQGIATLQNLAATDMVMTQAQIPAGGLNQTPRTMYITGVRISACSYTATQTAPAAGQHILMQGIFYGNTTANPTTAESGTFVTATVKAPRKIPISTMTQATGASPVGTAPDRGDIFHTFQAPLIVNPGEYVQLICKMVNGAATATGGLFFIYNFDGYWE